MPDIVHLLNGTKYIGLLGCQIKFASYAWGFPYSPTKDAIQKISTKVIDYIVVRFINIKDRYLVQYIYYIATLLLWHLHTYFWSHLKLEVSHSRLKVNW